MNEPTPTTTPPRAPARVLTIQPVVLPVPGRPIDLEVRVSAPATGRDLPILLVSHGHGPSNFVSSLHGYAPVANHFASRGFVLASGKNRYTGTGPELIADPEVAKSFLGG